MSAPTRKAYVIKHTRSMWKCLTCGEVMKSSRAAMKHECTTTTGRENADRTAGSTS